MSNDKYKSTDAVNHRETKALMQSMKASPVPRRFVTCPEVMVQKAMETIAAVKSVTQAGLLPVAAISSAYVHHIRQMDSQMHFGQPQRKTGIEKG